MKHTLWSALPAAVIFVSVIFPTRTHAQLVPAGLTGSLTANPSVVQVGQSPKLTWSINYPSVVKKYVTIVDSNESGGSGPGTITPIQNLYAEVRILGQGVTVQSGNSYNFVNTQAMMSINSSSSSNFKQIFYGTNPQIDPGEVINLRSIFGSTYSNNLIAAGRELRFGGRYYHGGWGTLYRSNDGTDNVRFLINGDRPPSNVPDYNAPSLESFIRPYLDTTGKVKIGPMDVIVFMELTHTGNQKSDVGYDLQDLVLLVTFRTP